MEFLEEMEYVEDIPEGWKWVKLGDIAEIKMGQSPESKYYNDKGIGFPFLQGSKTFGYKYPEVEIYCSNPIKVAKKGEILISVRAPVGDINIATQDICIGRGIASINSLSNQNEFLFYYLKHSKNDLLASESGTVFGSINKETLYNFPILLPPLPEQKAIADVLSSIDNKIELLHRQNKTLEEMAMTLFRQWFIEPTKDGLPDGWKEVSLGDVFDIGIGRTPPRKESYWFSLNPKDIRWISVKDLGSIDTFIINTSEFLKEEAVKKFNIPIIPDNTVVLSFKLTVGRVGITFGEMVSNEAIAHFKPKPNSKISSNYLYLFLKTLDFSTFGSTSSIAEAINSKIIKEIKIQIPNDELILSFQSLIDPIFQKIRHNVFQIQTLEKLRDTLLPKLMSGEIRVKI
jgi:type I restriction enzyme S subunit